MKSEYALGKKSQLKKFQKLDSKVEKMNDTAAEMDDRAQVLTQRLKDRKQLVKFGKKLTSVGNGYHLVLQDASDSYFEPYVSCSVESDTGEDIAMILDDTVGQAPSQWTLRFEKQIPLKDLNNIIELVSSHNEFYI